MFSGTIRSNLDPFGLFDDETLRSGLFRCQLPTALSETLDGKVEENGANFSVGQRQLLCIARAFLTRARIIVMDEATAAVDVETDACIQRTIKREFAACTCLTIAHRLNTIMDADRVLVLQGGVVAEFDTPAALLQDKQSPSMFAQLVAHWDASN